jgi:acyl dehydratase
MAPTKLSYAELADHVGEELGASDWVEIAQDRIDTFADATGDHQWIHVDADRAQAGPFGTTIAHGYLTLSLIPMLYRQVVEVSGVGMTVNYGSDKLRFVSPVPVGSRVRLSAKLAGVEPKGGGSLVTMAATIEIEGAPKPAVVTDVLYLMYPA